MPRTRKWAPRRIAGPRLIRRSRSIVARDLPGLSLTERANASSASPTQDSFEYFFTDDALRSALCDERIGLTRKLHNQEFLHRAGHTGASPSSASLILKYFPPRSRWKKRTPKERRGSRPSYATARQHLSRTTRILARNAEEQDQSWIRQQVELFGLIRWRALGDRSVQIKPPKILLAPKSPQGKQYRIIASYDLEDKLLLGQTARYLRTMFDPAFLNCSYAFRVGGESSPPNHHDAFRRLISYWTDRSDLLRQPVWAVEADIQGFYDNVSHSVVRRRYEEGVRQLRSSGTVVDARARRIIHAFLRSYDYRHYAYEQACSMLLEKGVNVVNMDDRLDQIRMFYADPEAELIGIPQGGALSCFIANLLLHSADIAVMGVLNASESQSVYVRYCDDMIALSTDYATLDRTREVYEGTLAKLKLPYHPFRAVNYGKEFWSGKSKGPYRWGKKSAGHVPWLAFVGYQLRYDGLIRVRPSSIAKELRKQARITTEFLGSIQRFERKSGFFRRSRRSLLRGLRDRLEAMSVGKRRRYEYHVDTFEECWCAAWECLRDGQLPSSQPIVRQQLRALDRGRRRQMKRAERQLKRRQNPASTVPLKDNRPRSTPGKPMSYSCLSVDSDGEGAGHEC